MGEECWLDNVQQERAARGMEPSSFADLQEHYKNLTIEEKTKLEKDEDELLAVSLYNLTCICLTLRVPPNLVRTRIRRMLAKAHLSLKSSKELSTLLDNIMDLTRIKRFREPGPSMLDLKPSLGVRHRRQQAFIAYFGKADNEKSPIVILEICQSAMIIRSGTTGVIHQRWWYHQILNTKIDETTKHLFVWRKNTVNKTENNDKTKVKVAQFYCPSNLQKLHDAIIRNWSQIKLHIETAKAKRDKKKLEVLKETN